MIHRRTVLCTLGAWVALATTPGALAQQRKVWRVGFLAQPVRPDRLDASRFGAFARGQNVTRPHAGTLTLVCMCASFEHVAGRQNTGSELRPARYSPFDTPELH